MGEGDFQQESFPSIDRAMRSKEEARLTGGNTSPIRVANDNHGLFQDVFCLPGSVFYRSLGGERSVPVWVGKDRESGGIQRFPPVRGVPTVIDDDEMERRIAARAHAIWEEEGCPEGRAEEHWERAREELAIADNLSSTLLPNPRRSDRGHAPGGEPVEEPAFTIENQGDLPGLTDQGRNIEAPRFDRAKDAGET
jgi:hypothetical protein